MNNTIIDDKKLIELREHLRTIQSIADAPRNVSYEYDPTPTDGERLNSVARLIRKALQLLP